MNNRRQRFRREAEEKESDRDPVLFFTMMSKSRDEAGIAIEKEYQ